MRKSFRALPVAALGLLLLASGCEKDDQIETLPAGSGCETGSARIQIGDGFLSIVCGCQEAPGTTVGTGTPLSCTVPAGTQVVFMSVKVQVQHQIISSGGLAIAPTPIFDPEGADVQNYVVPTTAAGTYLFEDAFNSQLSGEIIAL